MASEQTWRVAYGSWWDPDTDKGGFTWDQARDELRTELVKVREQLSDCPAFAKDAADSLARVEAATPGTEIDEEVEGQPYRITRD